MIATFFLKPYIGLLAGMAQAADGSGLGIGVEGGLSAGAQRTRLVFLASYSKLSSETIVDTVATGSGGGYLPGEIPATRSMDALDFALGPSMVFGRLETSLWLGTSFHSSHRATDNTGYTLEEYLSHWVFLAGGGLGWNWEKMGLCLFLNRHMGQREDGLWVIGGKLKLYP